MEVKKNERTKNQFENELKISPKKKKKRKEKKRKEKKRSIEKWKEKARHFS
jgi:hypothetical protein